MSVRAYRVKNINFANGESFNLWHDEKLMEFFEENGFYETLNEGTGLTELLIETLQEAVDKAKELELDEYQVKALKKDIKWGKKEGWEYVRYYCF